MGPTPSHPDDTLLGAYVPLDPAAARVRIRELAAELFGEMQEPIVAFAARLPDVLVDEFLQLLLSLDSQIIMLQMNREDIVWRALTAHLPGLAPALEVLRAHLQEDMKPSCVRTSEWCDQTGQLHSRDHCRIAHEAGYASYPTAAAGRGEAHREVTPPQDDDSTNLTRKNRRRY